MKKVFLITNDEQIKAIDFNSLDDLSEWIGSNPAEFSYTQPNIYHADVEDKSIPFNFLGNEENNECKRNLFAYKFLNRKDIYSNIVIVKDVRNSAKERFSFTGFEYIENQSCEASDIYNYLQLSLSELKKENEILHKKYDKARSEKLFIITSNEEIISKDFVFDSSNVGILANYINAAKLSYCDIDKEKMTIDSFNGSIPFMIFFDKESKHKKVNAIATGITEKVIYGDVIVLKDNDSTFNGFDYVEESNDGKFEEDICEHWFVEDYFMKIRNKRKEDIKNIHEHYDKKDTPFGTLDY